MRFVDDEEVIGKEKAITALEGVGVIGRRHQCEQQRMVENDDVGFGDLFTGFLVEASAFGPAEAGRAGVRLAADLRPHFWVRAERQGTECAVGGLAGPRADLPQFFQFAAGEKVIGRADGAFEAGWAQVITTAFEQHGLERRDGAPAAEQALHDGDVLPHQLFLQIDGMC